MPSFLTHLDIANQCIEKAHLQHFGWFMRDKFMSGSLAPDLGYFNEKELLYSHISHSSKNKKVLKKFFKYSKTPEELSFSFGFLSHLITDKIMEKVVNQQASQIKSKPWYILKQPNWRKLLPADLHHIRIEWFLDLDTLNTQRGQLLSNSQICMPEWHTKKNIITKSFKKLFNLEVNYNELDSALNSINQLKPKILTLTRLAGLKNIFNKKLFSLEKLNYHFLRKIMLLTANFTPRSVYLWSLLDPLRLTYTQKNIFQKSKNKVIKKFSRYIKFKTHKLRNISI